MSGDEVLPRVLGDRRRTVSSPIDESLDERGREIAIGLDERGRRLHRKRSGHAPPRYTQLADTTFAGKQFRDAIDDGPMVRAREEGPRDAAVLEHQIIHEFVRYDLDDPIESRR